jgi:peptidyl-prolyl cis-trans isomerase C
MTLHLGSKKIGTLFAATAISLVVLFSTAPVAAQDADDTLLFDDAVLDLLLESRIQRPANQASSAERASAIDELTSIYLISNLPRAIELGDAPEVKAQIELQRRALIFNAFAMDFIANNQPSDQEIFNLYEEQVALSPPKEFKARHILVDTQGAAIALIEELQGGADFVELAKTNSTGPSGPSGGDLGWFTAQSMVKPFSDAVSIMEDGAFTTTPVQTQFGWHVILREDSRDSAPPPLDSVRDVIAQQVSQQKFQEFLSSLRSSTSE